METAKKRFRPAALSAAAAVALVAGFLTIVPANAATAAGDPNQSCAKPIELSGDEQRALYERTSGLSSDDLAAELLCFSTVGSNPKPGGTLNLQVSPVYANTTLSSSSVNWLDEDGTIIGSSLTSDGADGWTSSLSLADGHSGKTIHPELSDIQIDLPLEYEVSVPDLWDQVCLDELTPAPVETPPADPTTEPTDGETPPTPVEGDPTATPAPTPVITEADREMCLVEPGYTQLADQLLRVQGASFVGAGQAVSYAPATLGTVSISGEALVTTTLKSKITGATKAKTVSFQWLRSGAAIKGATGSTYKVVDADRSKDLTLRVTASSPGQPVVVRPSNKISKVLGKLSTPNPKVSLVNGGISCPQWNCNAKMQVKATVDKGATAKYQWYRNGKAIKGATKSTYAVKFKYSKGLKYTVKYTATVEVSKSGFKTEKQSSESTASAWVKLPK